MQTRLLSSVGQRAALGLAVLFSEYLALYLALAHRHDGAILAKLPPYWGVTAWYATLLVGAAGALAAAVTILGGAELRSQAGRFRTLLPPIGSWWLALHVASYAGSAGVAMLVFARPQLAAGLAAWLLVAWLSGLGLAVAALCLALFGSSLGVLQRSSRGLLLSALLVTGLACFAALEVLPSWPSLAPLTLVISSALLRLFFADVVVQSEAAIIGLPGFSVTVAPSCSGVEGMALLAMFLAGYLVRFRRDLRFPRALLLVPAGVFLAFLANAARIASLVALGARADPEIAKGGFHSMAGWIFFCVLAVGLVVLAERSRLLLRGEAHPAPYTSRAEDDAVASPMTAYCLPFLVILAVGLVTRAFSASTDMLYPLRVFAAAGALWLLRNHYRSLVRAPSPSAIAIGVLVFALWLLMHPAGGLEATAAMQNEMAALPLAGRVPWLAMRVLGSALVVPIVEELAFRGFLQRRVLGDPFERVPQGRFGMSSLIVSAVTFGVLHPNWLPGTLAGVLFSIATYRRGQLVDAIAAHATANALLCAWVLTFQRWDLW
ncbi:MAG: exosortase E/protease, VPEID-CTERM system [Myxococcales bacterium]|nr:exosortase E/protease, VPEID-CTERM system [Myxococcales bacterium]